MRTPSSAGGLRRPERNTNTDPNTNTNPSRSAREDDGVSTTVIVAAAAGGGVALLLAAAAAFTMRRRRLDEFQIELKMNEELTGPQHDLADSGGMSAMANEYL